MEIQYGAKRNPAAATQSPQAERMRSAIDQAVAVGPAFLRGDVDAVQMAKAMVAAVRTYGEQERAAGGDGSARDREAQALQHVLGELLACGSGFLAGRCDAACVARTMTQMVHAFGAR